MNSTWSFFQDEKGVDSMKVMLDAGHGGYDNGAVFNDRKEKYDNLDLTLAVGQILEQNGVDVLYTREMDDYLSESAKASMANKEKADVLISFHRNFTRRPNETSGVLALVKGEDITGEKLAKDMNEALARIGFNNLGIEIRNERDILKKTKMPAALFLIGFINNDKDNDFLDSKFQTLVETIAGVIYKMVTGNELKLSGEDVITNHDAGEVKLNPNEIELISNFNTGVLKPPSNAVELKVSSNSCNNDLNKRKYYVQIGLYKNYRDAELLVKPLKTMGYPVKIDEHGSFYVVVVGDVNTILEGKILEADLKNFGYETLLLLR